MPKSSLAKAKYAIGSSRGSRSAHTLLLQMARDAEKLADQGQRIKQLREAMRTAENKRVTQPVVAEAVGVTPRAYQEWESGRGDMKPENVKALADFFETTPDYIEYGVEARDRSDTPDLTESLTGEPPWVGRLEGKIDRMLKLFDELNELPAAPPSTGALPDPGPLPGPTEPGESPSPAADDERSTDEEAAG